MKKSERAKLQKMLYKIGIYQKEPCNDEENNSINELVDKKQPIPDNVFEYFPGQWNKIIKTDLTDKEIDLYIKLKQTRCFIIIRNCLLFFVVWLVLLLVLIL